MAFCRNCGAEIDDKAVICPKCGVSISKFSQVQEIRKEVLPDSGGFGWGLLGFIFPLIGFILYLVWKDTKPKTGSACGKGALWAVLIWVIIGCLATCVACMGAM